MNDQLVKFARDTLKTGLAQCSDAQVLLFKRMYCHSTKDLDMDIVGCGGQDG